LKLLRTICARRRDAAGCACATSGQAALNFLHDLIGTRFLPDRSLPDAPLIGRGSAAC
jgi:hypothetical protein